MGSLAQNAKPVSKSFRNKDLPFIALTQVDTHPAPECGGSGSNVYRHIKYFSGNNLNQFRLRTGCLKMKPPQDVLVRIGQVVLDEFTRHALFPVSPVLEGLQEISPAVGVHLRLDDQQAG